MSLYPKVSMIGGFPLPREILVLFDRYNNVYRERSSLSLMNDWADKMIAIQESIGLDYFTTGHVHRASLNACIFDSCKGFLSIRDPYTFLLNDGQCWDVASWSPRPLGESTWIQPNYLARHIAIVVDEMAWQGRGPEDSIFYLEALALKKRASRNTIVSLPAPYDIVRRTWSPKLSRTAYKSREDFQSAIVALYTHLIPMLEDLGVSIIQFDTHLVSHLLDDKLREHLGLDSEFVLFEQGLAPLIKSVQKARSRLSLSRTHPTISQMPWSKTEMLERIVSGLPADEFAIPISMADKDALPLAKLRGDSTILVGISSPSQLSLESAEYMFSNFRAVMQQVPLEKIHLSHQANFVEAGELALSLAAAESKLRANVLFAQIVADHGTGVEAERAYSKGVISLAKDQENNVLYPGMTLG